MTSPNDIMTARIPIEADISDVQKKVPEAKQKIKSLGDESAATGKKIGDSFEDAGERIEKSTAGIRKFTGALSSTVGAITAVTGAATGLAGVLLILKNRHEQAEQAAALQSSAYNELTRTLNDYRNQEVSNIEEAEEAFTRVAKAIDAQNGVIKRSRLDSLFATARQIEEEKRLEAQVNQTKDAYAKRGDAIREDARIQREAIESITSLVENQEISLLPDTEQLKAKAEQQKRVLQETFKNIILPEGLLDSALDNIDKITAKQLEAEQQRQRIADDAQRRRDDEADRRSQERAQREIQIITDGLNSLTNSDLITTLEAIPQALRGINNNIGRLPR